MNNPGWVGYAHVGGQAALGQLCDGALRWCSGDPSLFAAARAHGDPSPEPMFADVAVRGLGPPPPAAAAGVAIEPRRPGDRFWLVAGNGGGLLRAGRLPPLVTLSHDIERAFAHWCDVAEQRGPYDRWEFPPVMLGGRGGAAPTAGHLRAERQRADRVGRSRPRRALTATGRS